MSHSGDDRGCSGDDESIRRLHAALTWEAGGRGPKPGFAVSVLMHCAALAPFVLAARSSPQVAVEEGLRRLTVTLVPASSQLPPKPPPPSPAMPGIPAPEVSEGTPAKVTVELNSISVDIAVDAGNQLQEVVERRGGELALLEKEDRTHAQSVFQPPEWSRILGPKNVSDKFIVLMEPAGDWKVFRDLAGQYDMDLNQYQGAALFDMGFRHCLEDAIRAKANSQSSAGGRVTFARLAFTVDSPCGITALEVEFAPKSAR